MAALAASAIPMILSTGLSVAGSVIAGQQQKASYDYEAAMYKQQAGQEVAASQRTAADKRRLGLLTLERAQAISGGSGSDPNSPSVLNLEGDIAGQTEYNSATALYNGKALAQGLTENADAATFSGQQAANAGIIKGISSGLSGAMTFATKYGEGDTPSTDYGAPGADINYNPAYGPEITGGGYAQGY